MEVMQKDHLDEVNQGSQARCTWHNNCWGRMVAWTLFDGLAGGWETNIGYPYELWQSDSDW
jgi:hypothetical protein